MAKAEILINDPALTFFVGDKEVFSGARQAIVDNTVNPRKAARRVRCSLPQKLPEILIKSETGETIAQIKAEPDTTTIDLLGNHPEIGCFNQRIHISTQPNEEAENQSFSLVNNSGESLFIVSACD